MYTIYGATGEVVGYIVEDSQGLHFVLSTLIIIPFAPRRHVDSSAATGIKGTLWRNVAHTHRPFTARIMDPQARDSLSLSSSAALCSHYEVTNLNAGKHHLESISRILFFHVVTLWCVFLHLARLLLPFLQSHRPTRSNRFSVSRDSHASRRRFHWGNRARVHSAQAQVRLVLWLCLQVIFGHVF